MEQLLAFGVDTLDYITSAFFYIVYPLFLLMLHIKVYLPHALTLMVIYPLLGGVWEVCQNCASVLLSRVWFSSLLVGRC